MFSEGEIFSILAWWLTIFIVGIAFFPLTNFIFKRFIDRGYLFSKVLGLGIITYVILILGFIKILPFSFPSVVLVLSVGTFANYFIFRKSLKKEKLPLKIIIFEEIIFLIGIFIWAFVRAHEPTINGLEKFMDFGFVNSILRSTYMPPADMWFTPLSINYYYFGHLSTAVLTKLSLLPSFITYNLMLATLFAFCFSLSFSIALNLITKNVITRRGILASLITGGLVAIAGNLHTIYAFFQSYNVEKVVPLWELPFLASTFPNGYWYPNATRFIPLTIHEFPLYSFVVSDLHGHVIDIMYVLLTIALAFVLFKSEKISKLLIVLISFMLAVLYMTNVWDALIYLILLSTTILIKNFQLLKITKFTFKKIRELLVQTTNLSLLALLLFVIFSLPFNLFFKPFASGVGLLCAPKLLTDIGKLGPFMFEADHCQRSEWWQLLILYGFFYFFVFSFLIFIFRTLKRKLEDNDIFILILIVVSTLLIIIPEIVYIKDIYPAHYRANTMFKLVYQSFMMLSIVSGFVIFRLISHYKERIIKPPGFHTAFFIVSITFLILVFSYPYHAIKSYYADLKNYSGIDGVKYLENKLPEDYHAIKWIEENIEGQPVIVEAQGDSYTDYARISANTGLPTILGWTVHEWLWRGTYDIPAPRIDEVKNIYESTDEKVTIDLLKKHNVEYIYVGGLERQKYPTLNEDKFKNLGKVVFEKGNTRIYKLN